MVRPTPSWSWTISPPTKPPSCARPSTRPGSPTRGAHGAALPAYSPDMNPIEQAWSKLKTHLRAKAARTRDALERAIPGALATITPSNAQGWFRKAGYAPN